MTTVLKTRRYKAGYEVQTGRVDGKEVRHAYTTTGDYIGHPKTAFYLCRTLGIKPEKAESYHYACTIGFSNKEQKWFGWFRRPVGRAVYGLRIGDKAIDGFRIGDTVEEGDFAAEESCAPKHLETHPEDRRALPVGFTAQIMTDARRIAVALSEWSGW